MVRDDWPYFVGVAAALAHWRTVTGDETEDHDGHWATVDAKTIKLIRARPTHGHRE